MRDWRVRLAVAVLIGVGLPLAELALACRAPVSEACVWGKALLPVSLGVGLLVVGSIAFAILSAVASRWGKGEKGDEPAEPE